jgi:hypothetical protein
MSISQPRPVLSTSYKLSYHSVTYKRNNKWMNSTKRIVSVWNISLFLSLMLAGSILSLPGATLYVPNKKQNIEERNVLFIIYELGPLTDWLLVYIYEWSANQLETEKMVLPQPSAHWISLLHSVLRVIQNNYYNNTLLATHWTCWFEDKKLSCLLLENTYSGGSDCTIYW